MEDLIVAILEYIEKEMARQYWNAHQKEIDSPFRNTGATFSNDVFTVRAYNWDGNYKPNFEYKGLKIYWYKYLGRGIELNYDDINYDDKGVTLEFLIKMLKDCKESLDNMNNL